MRKRDFCRLHTAWIHCHQLNNTCRSRPKKKDILSHLYTFIWLQSAKNAKKYSKYPNKTSLSTIIALPKTIKQLHIKTFYLSFTRYRVPQKKVCTVFSDFQPKIVVRTVNYFQLWQNSRKLFFLYANWNR